MKKCIQFTELKMENSKSGENLSTEDPIKAELTSVGLTPAKDKVRVNLLFQLSVNKQEKSLQSGNVETHHLMNLLVSLWDLHYGLEELIRSAYHISNGE